MKEKMLKGRNLKRLLSVVLTLAVIFSVLTQGTFVYAASGNTYTITTNGMTWGGVEDAKLAKAGDIINVETTSSHGVRAFLNGGTSGDWADGTKSIDESGTLTLPAIPDGYKVVNIYAGVDMIITIGQDHVHNFTYTLATTNTKNDTIKAHCSAEGHTGANDATLTLTASSVNYSGSAYTGASLGDTSAWTTAGLTVPTIKYVGRASTTYTESATAPTTVGTYTAKITAGDKTATKDFEITKANQTAPAPEKKEEAKKEETKKSPATGATVVGLGPLGLGVALLTVIKKKEND